MSEQYKDGKYFNAGLYGLIGIEQRITDLIKQTYYLSDKEKQQLINCCFFAATAHDGQMRKSGGPYIHHPIKVAEILAKEVSFDLPVLQAAILHDVIEDTPVSKAEVIKAFGTEVANLVDGVSKLEKDKNLSVKELQAKTFEKLANAMQIDPRVVMIKFSDRMHNMQTLGALKKKKRKRIANETLEVYAPIAAHLGMFIFKAELEKLAFKHLYPWRYRVIRNLMQEDKKRLEIISQITKSLRLLFKEHKVSAIILQRRRNVLNIYKKLKKNRFNRRPLENASIPFIILTNNIDDCYRTLGIIHQFYTPVFHKLTDYIASPRTNGYQSIHTSVITKDRRIINFQIRTKDMDSVAESGIIAIWRYHNREKIEANKYLPQDIATRRWLSNIKTLSSMAANSMEFYEAFKFDLSALKIQVLTPKGEPISLPKGATVIDFAYHIHSDIGNNLKSSKVNGVDVSLDYKLHDGQMVEVCADKDSCPHSSWLQIAKTARARTAVRHYLRELSSEELVKEGLNEIQNYLAKKGIHYRQLKKMLLQVAESQYQISLEQLLYKIALNDVKCRRIMKFLQRVGNEQGVISSITIKTKNQPRSLAKIADIIGRNKANILRIKFPDNTHAKCIKMIFIIHLELFSQLNNIVNSLNSLRFISYVKHEEKNNEKNH